MMVNLLNGKEETNMLMMKSRDLFKSDNELISLVLSALVAAHRVERGPGKEKPAK